MRVVGRKCCVCEHIRKKKNGSHDSTLTAACTTADGRNASRVKKALKAWATPALSMSKLLCCTVYSRNRPLRYVRRGINCSRRCTAGAPECIGLANVTHAQGIERRRDSRTPKILGLMRRHTKRPAPGALPTLQTGMPRRLLCWARYLCDEMPNGEVERRVAPRQKHIFPPRPALAPNQLMRLRSSRRFTFMRFHRCKNQGVGVPGRDGKCTTK